MSAENVDIVRRALAAFEEKDFEASFALASTDIEVYPRPEEPGVREREVGVASGTGIRLEDHFAHACRVREGKIIEWRMYGPMAEAFDAVEGLGG